MCCVAMFSCNNEDILSENTSSVNNHQTIEQSFNVTENDIYNIVSDFYQPNATRAFGSNCEIVKIDTVKNKATRNNLDTNLPENLVYFVQLANGSTMIVSGDKRAEPVYACFDNISLSVNEKGELVAQDSIPEIVGALIENYIVDVRNCIINNNKANDYYNKKATRVADNDEVLPKLAYRFPESYNYNESNNISDELVMNNARIWLIHSLCVVIPDNINIRNFNQYKLKASWKEAKNYCISTFTKDMRDDVINMSNNLPRSPFNAGSDAANIYEIGKGLDALVDIFKNGQNIPSISYDTDWYNLLNNLRLETGISIIIGCRNRKHPTMFRHTSYSDFGFFIADGYNKIDKDYFIHVIGPTGKFGIISGYLLDLNTQHAERFKSTYWTNRYGVPYQTTAINLHTTKY